MEICSYQFSFLSKTPEDKKGYSKLNNGYFRSRNICALNKVKSCCPLYSLLSKATAKQPCLINREMPLPSGLHRTFCFL